ncbi:MAG: CoA transferase, partial [Chloroflexota bacterium]|nr:CoA transferase [Chloroflexota bacterium]
MDNQSVNIGLLSSYRALDISDERGSLCGKVLGDLGADVIKIEPPGGDSARNIGPFYHDIPEPEKNLNWFFYNMNKRGITLNVEIQDGQEIFRQLVKKADIVIESFSPGYMDGLSLGYGALKEINPSIIMASITPFGQDGPYKDYKAPDIVVMAMSGLMYMTGDPDRSPVRIGWPQAYLHAAVDAATGIMMALCYRGLTGEGQHVEVSAQESTLWTMMNSLRFWELSNITIKRAGAFIVRPFTNATQRQTWRCKDGYVCFAVVGGLQGERIMRALVEWMDSEGMASDFLKEINWREVDFSRLTQDVLDKSLTPIDKFFMAHTKEELYEEAAKRDIALFMVATPKDLLESSQLASREYWAEIQHSEGCMLTCPNTFAKTNVAS